MKRIPLLLAVLLVLVLGACRLPAPSGIQPTPTLSGQNPSGQQPGAGEATATARTEPAAPAEKPIPSPTSTEPLAVTSTSQAPASTPVQPTATSVPASATPQATKAPTNTPKATVVAFDPNQAYGTPTYKNEMTGGSLTEWASPETGTLPDNDIIKLQFKDNKLYVTGKQKDFSTWWFSYHTLEDFYAEMTFDTEQCSGSDAYGMIVRGPEHQAGVSYGYVIAFTCDGQYWVFRLDGIDPWDATDLINETKSDVINTGSNKQNIMAVRAVGDKLTIYANGYQIAQTTDKEYSQGRIGVYVRASDTANYTYRMTKFVYWNLKSSTK